jgi:hypothetical protein
MILHDRAQRVFEYISQVYAIDLPVARDLTNYGAELWWQANFTPSPQCRIKHFDTGNNSVETNDQGEAVEDAAWLSVSKRPYDNPPPLPSVLRDWVELSSDPTKRPTPKPSIIKRVSFEAHEQRVTAFAEYTETWNQWGKTREGDPPPIPEILVGWIDEAQSGDAPPVHVTERETEERFEGNPIRAVELDKYIEGQWSIWAKRVLPAHRANKLYDEMFSLHQRLSVEGDRIEILWGHVLLTWNHKLGAKIYHPLILTPLNLEFHPERRTITLTPAHAHPSRFDIDCLRDLDYPHKDLLLQYVRNINSSESPPDQWSNNPMRGLAGTVTGYLSQETAEVTNLYTDEPVARPPTSAIPTIYNAPAIFVRQRVRHFWIDDAKNVAASIAAGAALPPFIRSLIPEDHPHSVSIDEDDTEPLLPLEYNDQQKAIWDRLRIHFAALVQGPPGTGKSHTIANIICALLARGKRVLVTSQTENALKVLRDLIPKEIRNLCVSQLGNDTESKTQLNNAVVEIGNRLSERNSAEPEKRVQQVRRELRAIHEEQRILRDKIRDWAELDSFKTTLGGEEISAHQAAKECSTGEANHAWFPDKVAPETEPPLSNEELKEMCLLLRAISSEDRKSCLRHLPDLAHIQSVENISSIFPELRSATARSIETEGLRADWSSVLRAAQPQDLNRAISLLESALSDLQGLSSEWQLRLLDLMASGENQMAFWKEFVRSCIDLRDRAWHSFQKIQGSQIVVNNLPINLDREAALDELDRTIQKGKNPSSFMTRLALSKAAKLFFDSVKVDGQRLTTSGRTDLVRLRFSYEACLKKFEANWIKSIKIVDGPRRDQLAPMPLADIDSRLKYLGHVAEWLDSYLPRIKTELASLGCPATGHDFHSASHLAECLQALQGQLAVIEEQSLIQRLSERENFLRDESRRQGAHLLWRDFADAIEHRSTADYESAYEELLRLVQLRPKVERLEHLLRELHNAAPNWANKIEHQASELGPEAMPEDWVLAWRWRRLHEWLTSLHNRESVESLQNRLEKGRDRERDLLTRLVSERTWQRQISNVKDPHYRALTAWAIAMKHFGRGTGPHAQRHLAAANKAMVEAVEAVPVWIMPLFRVVQSFPAKPGIFDVVIVDEASQCDIRALPILYRAKKVLVVGDPEQISPANVGIPQDKVFELIRQFLADIPHPGHFHINNSLYAIAGTIPRMDRILLTEHFRCVPAIIEFNNRLCPSYGGKLEPLRQPHPQEMLDPPIQTVFIENGFKNDNDINEPEAEAIVEHLVRLCRDERYASGGKNNRKRTMGVISLLGEKQAKHISGLIASHPDLDERERAERRIICGDAYAFQGDERDIMLLSLVIAPNAPFAAQVTDPACQRFNVATSRPRDQVFLFHSVQLKDINNEQCVRYKLLKWYLNPPIAEMEAGLEVLKRKAESQFEIDVGERIIRRGYTIIPQFRPVPGDVQYRIDLVVQGEKSRVAVECDGDQWHGPERWEYDQRREAQLRRAGWKFWRISGSAFYRNKDKALDSLWGFLKDAGVRPKQ